MMGFIAMIVLMSSILRSFADTLNGESDSESNKEAHALNMKLAAIEERQTKQEQEIESLKNENWELRETIRQFIDANQDRLKEINEDFQQITDLPSSKEFDLSEKSSDELVMTDPPSFKDIDKSEEPNGVLATKDPLSFREIEQAAKRTERHVLNNVAFYAYITDSFTSMLGPRQVVPFKATLINDGNAFNVHTSIFTVPLNGVYLFSFSCQNFFGGRIWLNLLVDGNAVSSVIGSANGGHTMGTSVVILRLQAGQSVWVAVCPDNTNVQLQNVGTFFSGVFLY